MSIECEALNLTEPLDGADDWDTLTPAQQDMTTAEYSNTLCMIGSARQSDLITEDEEHQFIERLNKINSSP